MCELQDRINYFPAFIYIVVLYVYVLFVICSGWTPGRLADVTHGDPNKISKKKIIIIGQVKTEVSGKSPNKRVRSPNFLVDTW